MEAKLSKQVEEKLGEAIELWADEILPGRPAILGAAVFSTIKRTLLEAQNKIEESFPIKEEIENE